MTVIFNRMEMAKIYALNKRNWFYINDFILIIIYLNGQLRK